MPTSFKVGILGLCFWNTETTRGIAVLLPVSVISILADRDSVIGFSVTKKCIVSGPSPSVLEKLFIHSFWGLPS